MITAVFIDSREPENIQALKFGGVPVMVTALEAGDLWVSCDDGVMLVIERKTPNDFLASIGDNRLQLQARKMRAMSEWCYLVLTGWLTPAHDGKTIVNGKVMGWNWDSVQGALLSVQEQGINIVVTDHDNHYEQAVTRLANRERKERVLAPSPIARIMTPGEQMLTSLPGIGLARAQNLMAEFDRPATALAWLTETGTVVEIDGIGNGIKHGVRRALGLQPGETLSLWSDEHLTYKEKST